jgi:signal transduction histidine kinase
MKERQSWHCGGEEPVSAGAKPVMQREIQIPHRPLVLNDAVLRADGAQADFVKGMTHELRTPLNVIIGLCQLLERDRKNSLSPMQKDAVDRMKRNAHSLLKSVNRLLECVRSGDYR